jgi:hypothetical protein
MNARVVLLLSLLVASMATSSAPVASHGFERYEWGVERGCVLVPRDAVPGFTAKPVSLAVSSEALETAAAACFAAAAELVDECRTAAASAPQRARMFACRPALASATPCADRDCLVRTWLRASLSVRFLRDQRDQWRARGRA